MIVKIYGSEALIRLHNQGEELNDFQINTINELKKSYKSLVICTQYFRERLPVRLILEDFNFEENLLKLKSRNRNERNKQTNPLLDN